MDDDSIKTRIHRIQKLICQLEEASQRKPGAVNLLAVSKGHSSLAIEQAYAAGLSNFGENYLQEALIKIQALSSYPICWHFIGAIQSNKARAITQHFSWAHSVNSKKVANLLNNERPASMPALNVCIQVNIDNEESKSGVHPDHLTELATHILTLPRLHLRGLMVIPKPREDEKQQYSLFLTLAHLLHQLNNQQHLALDTLSMGMSDDLKPAILAGSTLVRVGRAIFGERD